MKRKRKGTIDLSEPKRPKINFPDKLRFYDDLGSFKHGDNVIVSVETFRGLATAEQRGVLHWYCTELSEYLGIEMLEFKEMMKLKFAQKPKLDQDDNPIVDPETGEMMLYLQSTEKMNTIEKFEFTEKIRIWALDFLQYELPLPDKNYKLFKKTR